MDRSTISRILLAVGVFFLVWTLVGKGCGKSSGPNTDAVKETFDLLPLPNGLQAEGCSLDTPEFTADFGGTGGGLQSYRLKGTKYVEPDGKPIDLVKRSTVDADGKPISVYAPLHVQLRVDAGQSQVPGDLLQFQKDPSSSARLCKLVHETPGVVRVERTYAIGDRPYELVVGTQVTNLADGPRRHQLQTTLYALQIKSEEGSFLKRAPANAVFQGACAHDGKLEKKEKSSLRQWFSQTGDIDYAAITSSYFGEAIVPLDKTGVHCAMIAQDRGAREPDEQSLFRSELVYSERELAKTGDTASYQQIAFLGPKERHILAAAAGGNHHLDSMVDLGWFAFIARYLVQFLVFVHGLIGSWGIAIVLLTLTVRLCLLPLTLPQIRSSIAMRRLKPEIEEINKKFGDDAQAKMLATSQLYKKAGVNPLSGCLPSLVQMPVWFALYTALQTAIELFHEKFLFWNDLSAPDPRYILPLVLGVTMFAQQKVTPMQMDPAQQKIFTYFMPAMFTVFMLFLPAGLGIYMLTNSLLGIVQTISVEKYMRKTAPAEVKVTVASETKKKKGDDDDRRKPRPARELARAPEPPVDDAPAGDDGDVKGDA